MARILVIEDNLANLELMTYLLGAFGHTILTAQDGAEGLQAVQREMPDLILCDVHLPVLDGYEVARWLKSHPLLRSIPLLAVTALAMVGDRDLSLAAGFDGYIAKPITPETFLSDVELFLKEQQLPLSPFVPRAFEPSTTLSSSKEVILVVDDEPVNLQLACSTLQPSGYAVLTAGNMHQALALARSHRLDLIVSDINMADGSGYDFLSTLKADPQLQRIPFMFITSTSLRPQDQLRGLQLGALRVLCRPLDPSVLLAEIESCLRTGREG
ncbi:MAG: response regulator [Candidatus Tectimicrobiota bacterium]